ncbi:hypothetical protein L1987_59944 [Smallanthus sonchifolius]|uniref:Uncharacterized protein n=1 Tax=Smallanthus sonchifolius TaxID=185202 RepID=A0ACB9D6P4_9ASTR|nr:hypothetical protein L1987_59944 [Smallanthus sonchifolius]
MDQPPTFWSKLLNNTTVGTCGGYKPLVEHPLTNPAGDMSHQGNFHSCNSGNEPPMAHPLVITGYEPSVEHPLTYPTGDTRHQGNFH